MFRKRLKAVAVGALLLLGASAFNSVQASAVPVGPVVISSDNCGSVSRQGAWICVQTGPQMSPKRPAAMAASVPRSEWCNGWGCWSVLSDFYADFFSNSIVLGWNNQTIATVRFLAEYRVRGNQTAARPVQSTVSVYTVNTVFSGALFNGANQVPKEVASTIGTCSPRVKGAAAAHQLVSYTRGCVLYDSRNYDHNMVVQASWSLSGYPGYWYFFVHSNVAHFDASGLYRFHYATDLMGGSVGGGWHS
jgi:hypothetical protein